LLYPRGQEFDRIIGIVIVLALVKIVRQQKKLILILEQYQTWNVIEVNVFERTIEKVPLSSNITDSTC